MNKAMTDIVLPRKLQSIVPRSSLITICKLFMQPYLDYWDVIYDQPANKSVFSKIE